MQISSTLRSTPKEIVGGYRDAHPVSNLVWGVGRCRVLRVTSSSAMAFPPSALYADQTTAFEKLVRARA